MTRSETTQVLLKIECVSARKFHSEMKTVKFHLTHLETRKSADISNRDKVSNR